MTDTLDGCLCIVQGEEQNWVTITRRRADMLACESNHWLAISTHTYSALEWHEHPFFLSFHFSSCTTQCSNTKGPDTTDRLSCSKNFRNVECHRADQNDQEAAQAVSCFHLRARLLTLLPSSSPPRPTPRNAKTKQCLHVLLHDRDGRHITPASLGRLVRNWTVRVPRPRYCRCSQGPL